MKTIGQILKKDYLLLRESELSSNDLSKKLLLHAQYLSFCDFAEFRLMVPHNTPQSILQTLNTFISQQNIPGAIRFYINVDNKSNFDSEVIMNPELSFKEWIAILPSEDFRYESLRKKIWNLSMGGKALLILLPESVISWRKSTSTFKRIHLKGANMAFSGSSLYSMGWFHRSKIREIHQYRLVHIWLTPQIYDVNSALFKKDMAIRLDAITSFNTAPNDL
jgi:hypothetical protein